MGQKKRTLWLHSREIRKYRKGKKRVEKCSPRSGSVSLMEPDTAQGGPRARAKKKGGCKGWERRGLGGGSAGGPEEISKQNG